MEAYSKEAQVPLPHLFSACPSTTCLTTTLLQLRSADEGSTIFYTVRPCTTYLRAGLPRALSFTVRQVQIWLARQQLAARAVSVRHVPEFQSRPPVVKGTQQRGEANGIATRIHRQSRRGLQRRTRPEGLLWTQRQARARESSLLADCGEQGHQYQGVGGIEHRDRNIRGKVESKAKGSGEEEERQVGKESCRNGGRECRGRLVQRL